MKYIVKKGAPSDYIKWCADVKGKPNEDYRRLQNPEKASLHEALINEQGGLCAYTMRRITASSSHIEHIKPETLCRDRLRGSDLDYRNLIACHPKEGMVNPFRYGAQEKDDWWEDEGKNFVSPLNNQCEVRLTFNQEGKVSAVNGNIAAQTTINVLKINHPSLTEDRKRAIDEFVLGVNGDDPLSPKRATQAIESVCRPNSKGKFAEFCVAIRHALIEYVANEEKKAQRRKFAQSQKNKNR